MSQKLSITDLPIKGKKVLMRVDFNVPLDQQGEITDDTRMLAALHSIQYVLEQGGTLILMSHLGRPKGKRVEALSLKPCAALLAKILGKKVLMAPDCVGADVEEMVKNLQSGDVLLLENLRFHSGEENPDGNAEFVQGLARLGDLYVDDAFGTAHRRHASNVAITEYFPGRAMAGFLFQKEIKFLGEALFEPERPFWAIIGGAKVSSKIGILKSLLDKVDGILIGGGMAFTFLKAQGYEVGDSLVEEDQIEDANKIIEESRRCGVEVVLPVDHLVVDRINENAEVQVISLEEPIQAKGIGVDVGPKTLELFAEKLKGARTVFWNGPLGVFEVAAFSEGTRSIAEILANLDAITIVGGGDSAAALHAVGYAERVSHISTGGGASLEYIKNEILPAIEALSDKKQCEQLGG